jgi:hypothetical protein
MVWDFQRDFMGACLADDSKPRRFSEQKRMYIFV